MEIRGVKMEYIQIFIETISGEKLPVEASWTIDKLGIHEPSTMIEEEISFILFEHIKNFIKK
jgi:hypothetical protein